MYPPEIIELVKASRLMLDAKGWHEIDGDCSICLRFKKAVEVAENTAEQSVQSDGAKVCAECGYPPSHHDPSSYVWRKSPRR